MLFLMPASSPYFFMRRSMARADKRTGLPLEVVNRAFDALSILSCDQLDRALYVSSFRGIFLGREPLNRSVLVSQSIDSIFRSWISFRYTPVPSRSRTMARSRELFRVAIKALTSSWVRYSTPVNM